MAIVIGQNRLPMFTLGVGFLQQRALHGFSCSVHILKIRSYETVTTLNCETDTCLHPVSKNVGTL